MEDNQSNNTRQRILRNLIFVETYSVDACVICFHKNIAKKKKKKKTSWRTVASYFAALTDLAARNRAFIFQRVRVSDHKTLALLLEIATVRVLPFASPMRELFTRTDSVFSRGIVEKLKKKKMLRVPTRFSLFSLSLSLFFIHCVHVAWNWSWFRLIN